MAGVSSSSSRVGAPAKRLTFVDLFAGLGGFHLALSRLGHQAVFACELDEGLRKAYESNFGLRPAGDIRLIDPANIPSHDILCAGFPCQPFSKAGSQEGFRCPEWGDLFGEVLRIIRHHRPRYLLLENVANLEKHDNGETWRLIRRQLEELGYEVKAKRLSPHRFGIPQIRERLIIVGSLGSLSAFDWPDESGPVTTSIRPLLERHPKDARPISPQVESCLEVWQEFLETYPQNEELPSFPVWSMEFGATYPYERTTPYSVGKYGLRNYRGAHGLALKSVAPADRLAALPAYAQTPERTFPDWKVDFIAANRDLFAEHRAWIRPWQKRIQAFPPSLQKFEWNCKGEERDIWQYVIQFRASGVRVKRPTSSPSLISMTTTQVPIVAWEKRYMTARECARLQGMADLDLPITTNAAYRALGNAVNVDVVEKVARALLPAMRHSSRSPRVVA